jgi:hypothetical protein
LFRDVVELPSSTTAMGPSLSLSLNALDPMRGAREAV